MLDVIRIEMRACDPSRNCFRAWRIEAGQDLFGLWTASVSFGRIGRSGRRLSHAFPTETATLAFVRAGLRRRQTSVKRFGVPYRLTEASPAAAPLLELTGVPVGDSGVPSGPKRPCATKASEGSCSVV